MVVIENSYIYTARHWHCMIECYRFFYWILKRAVVCTHHWIKALVLNPMIFCFWFSSWLLPRCGSLHPANHETHCFGFALFITTITITAGSWCCCCCWFTTSNGVWLFCNFSLEAIIGTVKLEVKVTIKIRESLHRLLRRLISRSKLIFAIVLQFWALALTVRLFST